MTFFGIKKPCDQLRGAGFIERGNIKDIVLFGIVDDIRVFFKMFYAKAHDGSFLRRMGGKNGDGLHCIPWLFVVPAKTGMC